MKHPDMSELLAYVRRQLSGEQSIEVQQHVAQCEVCRNHCAEYMHVGSLLETWTQAPAYRSYPSLANAILAKAQEPEPTFAQRLQRSIAFRPLRFASIATGIVFAFLCTAVVVTLATNGGFPTFGGPNAAHTPPIVLSPLAPQPTPANNGAGAGNAGSTGAASTQGGQYGSNNLAPSLRNCTTSYDEAHQDLSICGSHFPAGHELALVVVVPGKDTSVIRNVFVHNNGTIQVYIPIVSCKDVPAAIYAQDKTDPVAKVQALHTIQFGGCSVSGQAS